MITLLAGLTLLLHWQAAQALIVPSYFDSAEHVRLILALAAGASPRTVWNHLTGGYYHLGYHMIIGLAARVLPANPIHLVLFSGPLLLALIPPGIYVLLRRFSGQAGAIFGALLCAWGWIMPAYALDWGKYPLVAGLALLPFTLAAWPANAKQPGRWVLFGLLTMLTLAIHTRLLIVLGMSALAWWTSPYLMRLPRQSGSITALSSVLAAGLWTATQPMLAAVFNPYLVSGWGVTALVAALLPFGMRAHRRAMLWLLMLMAAMLSGLHISAEIFATGQNLLDRPLVETALSLPLAALGGLGLDGLRRAVRPNWFAGLYAGAVVLVITTAGLQWTRPHCCIIVTEADAVALDWMRTTLPPDVRILIAATEMRLRPGAGNAPLAGSDAGVWIQPLAQRHTLTTPYNTDFGTPQTLTTLCAQRVTHIYVGNLGQIFNRSQIDAHPTWYRVVFSMPPARIYEITGCDDFIVK